MKLAWWWEVAGKEVNYFETDVPTRDYAVGMLAAELCDGPSFEADFIGAALTSVAIRNYAEIRESKNVAFYARLT